MKRLAIAVTTSVRISGRLPVKPISTTEAEERPSWPLSTKTLTFRRISFISDSVERIERLAKEASVELPRRR